MYFHLVYSPELSAIVSWRQSIGKLFRQATELMDLIDDAFVGRHTSPPFAFHPCPFHMGISLPLGTRLLAVFWAKRVRKFQVKMVRICYFVSW